jgi:type I restriction enzyme S subunit
MIEDNLLSLSYGRIIDKDISLNDGLLPESFETYQIVRPGDMVFRPTDLQNDWNSLRTAIVEKTGIITSAYIAMVPFGIFPKYLHYLLRFYDNRKVFYSMGGGLRQSMKYADLKRLPILLPQGDEQRSIAAFLDRETAKIDALVAEQRRLMELLKEKRQAVIAHAVTKGLNPHVPMKPSGIEWLGNVPAHWELRPIKHMVEPGTSITYGIVQAGPDTEGGIPYIRTSDMSGESLPESGYLRTTPEIDAAYSRSKVRPNDLVVAIRASLGKGLLVPKFLAGANLTQGTAKICPGKGLLPIFLLWAFNSDYCQKSIRTFAKGTTFLEITLDALRRIPLAVPPLREQQGIADYLCAEVNRWDALTAEAQRAIDLLQERRTALISTAVTGQIDVRALHSVNLSTEMKGSRNEQAGVPLRTTSQGI